MGWCYSPKTVRAFIGTRPAAKQVRGIFETISQLTQRESYWKPVEVVVEDLNRTLCGWGNYFCLGAVRRACGLWITTPVIGCVSGLTPNTKVEESDSFGKPPCISIRSSDSSHWQRCASNSREPPHDSSGTKAGCPKRARPV